MKYGELSLIAAIGLVASCTTVGNSGAEFNGMSDLDILHTAFFGMEDEAHAITCAGGDFRSASRSVSRKYRRRLDLINQKLVAQYGADEVTANSIVGLSRVQHCEETVDADQRVDAMLDELERRLEIS